MVQTKKSQRKGYISSTNDIDKEFIAFLERVGKVYGLCEPSVKIFGVLYIEPNEISMEEIAKRTGYSVASVFNTLKQFESLGVVQRIRKPGTKKAFFYTPKSMMEWHISKLTTAKVVLVQNAKQFFPEMLERYKLNARDESTKKKLTILERYYKEILLFEKLISKWIKDMERMEERRRKC
ncbi:MAG: transcriptional repressor [Candidatus Woesearchaeota archaeon]